MDNNALALQGGPLAAKDLENLLVSGDLEQLTTEARLNYIAALCKSLGLNPMTQPFEFIKLQGKLQLYAKRSCTDQLRALHKVSIALVERQRMDDVYIVRAHARTPDGREDEATGAVPIANLKGEALANAVMKCETKAKRRVTLSICGLGFIDESELDTVRGARFETPHRTPEEQSSLYDQARLKTIDRVAQKMGEDSKGEYNQEAAKLKIAEECAKVVEIAGPDAGVPLLERFFDEHGWVGADDADKLSDRAAARSFYRDLVHLRQRCGDAPPDDVAPPEEPKAKKPAKTVTTGKYAYLKEFQAVKQAVGEAAYRGSLGLNGYEKSDQIPVDKRLTVLALMRKELRTEAGAPSGDEF